MSEASPLLGKFVWQDLMTTDVERATAFYSDLFGWKTKDIEMGEGGTYRLIQANASDENGIGGITPLEQSPVSLWVGYCLVEDVDEVVAHAEKLGGKTLVPGSEIPGIGRFARIADPHGAISQPFKPNTGGGEDPTGPRPAGQFCWNEILAIDPEGEGKFHAEIYGWRVEAMDMGPAGTYFLFKRPGGGTDAGGMLQKPAGTPGPSLWVPYVSVDDADERTARVQALGGQVYVEPRDIPNVGRFSVFGDPTGATAAMLAPPK
jgi:uncharacterized protein